MLNIKKINKLSQNLLNYISIYNRIKFVNNSLFSKNILTIGYNILPLIIKKYAVNLYDLMFINKHTSKHYMIEFFTNSKKLLSIDELSDVKTDYIEDTTDKKTFFFNFWKKRLTTWKNSRIIHWQLYKNSTLKTRRYKNFLPPFLKESKSKSDEIINFFSFKFNFSNVFWKNFTDLYKMFFYKTFKTREVYQLPISLVFWNYLKKIKKIRSKIKFKIESWLNKRIEIKKRFWMEMRKKIPNFFYKQVFSVNNGINKIQYDFITNYFCIIRKENLSNKTNLIIHNNKLLKLHNFRYKC